MSKVVVVGGCGHVGLPLALAFARAGISTVSYDIDEAAVQQVNECQMPFAEPEADGILREVLESGAFFASSDQSVIREAEFVVVVVGTPVDEHLNPDPYAVPDAIAPLSGFLSSEQLLILRSTVYPGVTRLVEDMLTDKGLKIDVAFCPERIAEGRAFEELYSLPQIVSSRSDGALKRAAALFSALTDKIIETTPEEAELAKLFTNTWRYIKFAAANQFYMIANSNGVDFERVRHAITEDYPRAKDMPGAGFAAGPCLFKDTMQLAAFNNNRFFLGHAAMMTNEGLPMYVVEQLEEKYGLEDKCVGILGMAFKSESDDIRSSLSYKLKRILKFKAKQVLCSDPYVTVDQDLVTTEELIANCDLVIIGAPHKQYGTLSFDQPVADVWNCIGSGVLI